VQVLSVSLRDFRGYDRARAALGAGVTVLWGPNGAGKTNLLEAVYFGCTGHSCRTANERELVRFGADTTRVVLEARDESGDHELAVGLTPGEPKRMSIDGAVVQRLLDAPSRPLVAFFSPDRLELVKGSPALRRAHTDQFVTALWPARAATRRTYNEALAQRNSLLARLAAGRGARDSLHAWDARLADVGIRLMQDRRAAVALISERFHSTAGSLGLGDDAAIAYRPRSGVADAASLAGEFEARHATDIERRFTTHGPHRDEIAITLNGRALRAFGSQGQQRLALLALLFSERAALTDARAAPPLLLLDDVTSELDAEHRASLIELLGISPGQAVITTTDPDQIPQVGGADVVRLRVRAGQIYPEMRAA